MSDLDQLLQPTVAPAEQRPLPWRLSSQFWVAFLGGVPAVTAIAFLNARRLGLPAHQQRNILAAGVAAFLVTLTCMAVLGVGADSRTANRIVVRVIAVLLFLLLARLQRDADGHHQVFGSGQYASLWLPGGVAILLSFLVIFVVAFVLVFVLR